MDSILLIGSAGSVGHDIMYLMSSMNLPMKVIGADYNEDKGRYEVEESLQIAHNLGYYPDFSFQKIDLFNIEQTAEILAELKPSVVCNLSSLGSWWITRLLPDEEYKKIGPIGPWVPNHLTLIYKLMQAVHMSGIKTKVVNGALPDVTNVVLSKLGLAPTCGGGNMDIGLQRIKRIIARDMGVPYQSVQIFGVGHHGTFYTVKYHGPFWVKIIVDGTDVSERYPNEKIAKMYEEAGFASTQQFGGALVDQMKTATSFLNNILGLYFDTKKVHGAVAGPNGLPGAYPARFSAEGVEVVLPGISLQDAIAINEKGAQIDGVQEIKEDGTIVFMDENVEDMRVVVGYNCKELKPEESEARAQELAERLKKLYEKHNVS
ncbi:MAG: hypothetical protein U5L00_15640 [Desulfovermiculus sp.]|nr:hypothetical protein [Desulfovermiculus sp.]